MSRTARDLLDTTRRELAPGEHENRLVPLVAQGKAPVAVLGALAAEQHHVITSDWRSFLTLAARADQQDAREFFSGLGQGEGLALGKLAAFASACGLDADAVRAYEPMAGCQAYPAYQAWLALNGDPVDVVLALVANFSAWGNYCATITRALREHYGFDDEACGFFDFFATPSPEMEEQALAVAQNGIDAGRPADRARRYGRLLQSYELMFWNTLADRAEVFLGQSPR
ncbi:transcriptional regulator [Solihabitans fulvus]|uniref:Transcriptional regulator n=1 Tax=Solihabitans fulvus TaxID=1892852 RepID=A0A5B2XEQ6_9PSEU|nr:transcriptional regulator [Solihabitans fulvus]KAA2261272.1 transcriptional regulator [Solihabitans fulvus]